MSESPGILFAMTVAYLPETTGGVESTTHETCLALLRRGWRPAVLAGHRGAGGGVVLGYPIHRRRESTRSAADICRSLRADLAIIQLGAIVPLARTLVENGIPALCYLHNLEFDSMGGDLFAHPLLRYLTNSNFMAERLTPRLGARPTVIPPLIDPERYRTKPTHEVVTFVNPLPVKGLEIALHLAARRPDIPFEFVESWPLTFAERRRLASALADLPNVRLTPRSDDMRAVYGRSRLLLAPSRWEESWGRVASEAQISGLPVIASRIGGLPEAVGKGGILVDPDAPLAKWEAALVRLWDDPAAYRRYAARALAHAGRRAIRPDAVINSLCALVLDHLAACRGAAT